MLRVRIEGKAERKGSDLKKETPEKAEKRVEKGGDEASGKRKKNSKQQTHQERLKEFMASYTSEAPSQKFVEEELKRAAETVQVYVPKENMVSPAKSLDVSLEWVVKEEKQAPANRWAPQQKSNSDRRPQFFNSKKGDQVSKKQGNVECPTEPAPARGRFDKLFSEGGVREEGPKRFFMPKGEKNSSEYAHFQKKGSKPAAEAGTR